MGWIFEVSFAFEIGLALEIPFTTSRHRHRRGRFGFGIHDDLPWIGTGQHRCGADCIGFGSRCRHDRCANNIQHPVGRCMDRRIDHLGKPRRAGIRSQSLHHGRSHLCREPRSHPIRRLQGFGNQPCRCAWIAAHLLAQRRQRVGHCFDCLHREERGTETGRYGNRKECAQEQPHTAVSGHAGICLSTKQFIIQGSCANPPILRWSGLWPDLRSPGRSIWGSLSFMRVSLGCSHPNPILESMKAPDFNPTH